MWIFHVILFAVIYNMKCPAPSVPPTAANLACVDSVAYLKKTIPLALGDLGLLNTLTAFFIVFYSGNCFARYTGKPSPGLAQVPALLTNSSEGCLAHFRVMLDAWCAAEGRRAWWRREFWVWGVDGDVGEVDEWGVAPGCSHVRCFHRDPGQDAQHQPLCALLLHPARHALERHPVRVPPHPPHPPWISSEKRVGV